MAREKRIRLSSEEISKLKKYRESEYDESVPYGYIIMELIDEQ